MKVNTEKIARELFQKVYNGQANFMTPDVLRYGVTSGYAWEISEGTGIGGEPIFGLTVVNVMLGTPNKELSGMYYTFEEAVKKAKSITYEGGFSE